MGLLIKCKKCRTLLSARRKECSCGERMVNKDYYVEWWENGKRKRKHIGKVGYFDAKDIETNIHMAKRKKTSSYIVVKSSNVTFSEAARKTRLEKLQRGVKSNSLVIYDGIVRRIIAWYGDFLMSSITPEKAQEIVLDLNKKFKIATVNSYIIVLKEVFAQHFGRDHVFSGVKTRKPTFSVDFLSFQEEKKLLDVAKEKDEDMYDILYCFLSTGLRRSNVLNLTSNQIDIDEGVIRITAKRGKQHVVYINNDLKNILRKRMNGEERMWRISESALCRRFKKLLQMANLRHIRIHDLRHTVATKILKKTNNLKLCQVFLGHSSISTTSMYAHLMPGDMKQVADLISINKLDTKTDTTQK